MKKVDLGYRKNLGLLLSSLLFITILFIVSVIFARSMIENFVYSDFNNRKTEVFDESIKAFNDFFNNKIPEISYYQGYLDPRQATNYANEVVRSYPFVNEVIFYDVIFTNQDSLNFGVKFNHLTIHPKSILRYQLDAQNKLMITQEGSEQKSHGINDFNNMALKLVSYLDVVDETTRLSDNEIYKVFYTINPGKIVYMNIPRVSDLLVYKEIMYRPNLPVIAYDQDMFIFDINPQKIQISNTFPNLYESIEIVPIVASRVADTRPYLETELALPGALSNYKILFESSQSYIAKEVNRQFVPVIIGLVLLYLVLLLIVYLIFRNMLVNSKLFKLQYDFINNLTHEFKTPVSVIKIAGDNIRSTEVLSRDEKNLYANILDQEANKLNNLMNKLLSFTQIENKSIKFKGEWVDLKAFCEGFFTANKLKYPDMDIQLEIDVDRAMLTDPVLLTSVFQNLVDNTYKYSDASNKYLNVKVYQTKKNFVILFRDRGIGIRKSELNNIFKKFYRVKNQFNKQGSIGLGLAFCKEVTEFMGGDIKVTSEVGVGTSFTLLFPLHTRVGV